MASAPLTVAAQTAPSNETAAVQTAAGTPAQWLSEAKAEMAQGNFAKAEQHIAIADAMVQGQPPAVPLTYTPEMARKELAGLQSQAEEQVNTAKQSLLAARQKIARGMLEEAQGIADTASQLKIDWSKIGDSPTTVKGLIQRQTELAGMAQNQHPKYNELAATFLLKQAHTLIVYGDNATAKSLIDQAKMFPVEFNAETGDPAQLLALIDSSKAKSTDAKAEVMKLMSMAQLAVDKEEWNKANELVQKAKSFNVPDSAFAENETRPWQLELSKIKPALNRIRNTAQLTQDSNVVPSSFTEDAPSKVVNADYDSSKDATRNVQVAATMKDSGNDNSFSPAPSRGMELYRSGMTALQNSDPQQARDYFEMAWKFQDQLDSATRQSIQDQLAKMVTPPAAPATNNFKISDGVRTASAQTPVGQDPANVELSAPTDATTLFRELQSQMFRERAAAERMLADSPRKSLEKMVAFRSRIDASSLDVNSKRPLLTIIDRDIDEMQTYIEQNLSEIMVREENEASRDKLKRREQRRMDVETQLKSLSQDFNRLLEEEQWMQAVAVARQARDLAPNEQVTTLMMEKANFALNVARNEAVKSDKESLFLSEMHAVDVASTPFDSTRPLQYANTEEYKKRREWRNERIERARYDSESERRIWNLLNNQQVQGDFRGTLNEAVDQLAAQSGVNMVFDYNALSSAQVPMDRPVNVNLSNPISLKNALKTILGTQGLTFVVQDEVIKVTTPEAEKSELKVKTYYVGDLVVPINSFNSSTNMDFLQPNQNFNGRPYGNQLVNNNGAGQSMASMIAQQQAGQPVGFMGQQLPDNNPFAQNRMFGGNNGTYGGNGINSGQPYGQYNVVGPNRLGGISIQDFTQLINLIQTTIDPDGWDTTNGDGTIQPYVSNLSLVVSQTQEVQDQIQDLLLKLRELNDVQIVVEVRFITLADNFFERVGVDFNFNINDNSDIDSNNIPDEVRQSTVLGLNSLGTFNVDSLDIPFTQDSFTSAVPIFGGFDVGSAANFGFAILSDIEVFLLIQASKGDSRTNVTQAPTVTMFNGQGATVTDISQTPFVTSVTPVVGDFAVAHQPVITLLPEGVSMNVQAVVSSDRRFVRMTLVPFFSQIENVQTFTFTGSQTTRVSSDNFLSDFLDALDGTANDTPTNQDLDTITEGVTLQQPTIASTNVSTVVSVPDGGTILMGGIKRLSEQRVERGVPFLSSIPYVQRLFKNVGLGRETSNLMMMVTPRIIIQGGRRRASSWFDWKLVSSRFGWMWQRIQPGSNRQDSLAKRVRKPPVSARWLFFFVRQVSNFAGNFVFRLRSLLSRPDHGSPPGRRIAFNRFGGIGWIQKFFQTLKPHMFRLPLLFKCDGRMRYELDIFESRAIHPVDQATGGRNKKNVSGFGVAIFRKQGEGFVSRNRLAFHQASSSDPQSGFQFTKDFNRASMVVDDAHAKRQVKRLLKKSQVLDPQQIQLKLRTLGEVLE